MPKAIIAPNKKARKTVEGNSPIRPIPMAPGTGGEGRKYLHGKAAELRMRGNKPYVGPGRTKGL
jgi:hypothetical protein